jgi:hypothetical protein
VSRVYSYCLLCRYHVYISIRGASATLESVKGPCVNDEVVVVIKSVKKMRY